MTQAELARTLNVTAQTIINWEKDGMPVKRIEGLKKPKYNIDEVLKWLASREVK